jgi:hypothetical protein
MSSLLTYLTDTGSALSYYRETFEEDQTIPINPQANRGVKYSIHSNSDGGDPSNDDSYSLNGSGIQQAQNAWNVYNDGLNNPLPPPSNFLDLNGYPPSTPSAYVNNLPDGLESAIRG